jgi:hypothetical protein
MQVERLTVSDQPAIAVQSQPDLSPYPGEAPDRARDGQE